MTWTRYLTVVLFSGLVLCPARSFGRDTPRAARLTAPANVPPQASCAVTDPGPRVEVDPNDRTVRLLVLAPGGPLLVRLTMTIDGLIDPAEARAASKRGP